MCATTSTWPAAAASLADGAFYNNGQSCCSVERIYVHVASTTSSSTGSWTWWTDS